VLSLFWAISDDSTSELDFPATCGEVFIIGIIAKTGSRLIAQLQSADILELHWGGHVLTQKRNVLCVYRLSGQKISLLLPGRTHGIAFRVKGHVSVNAGTTIGLRFD
jgi:hypothetical protein